MLPLFPFPHLIKWLTYAAHVNKTRYFTSASISVADLSTDDEQNIKKAKIRDTMKESLEFYFSFL